MKISRIHNHLKKVKTIIWLCRRCVYAELPFFNERNINLLDHQPREINTPTIPLTNKQLKISSKNYSIAF